MQRAKNFIKRILPPVIIIMITVIMSLISYTEILKIEEEKCWNVLQDTASAINNEISVRFKDNITILKLAAGAMVQEDRVESYDAIIKHINAFQPMTIFSRIDVLYPDNTILFQNGAHREVSDKYSFEEISANGEHMSKRTQDVLSENEVIYYAVPVVSNNETQAVLIGVIECRTMPELFKARAYDGEAFSCIVDYRDGSFIMDDWHDKLGNMYEMKPRKQLSGYEDVDLISDVKAAKTGVTAYQSAQNGQNSYMYYTPVGVFDWELLIVVQENIAFASLLKLKSTLYTLGVVESVLLLLYFIWTFITVNQLEKSKVEIEEKRYAFELLSYNDTLTMLYNRNKYNQTVEMYENQCMNNIGVAFFDLNGLKQVNDDYGHKVGDILIQNTAKQISTVFKDMTYRIGGDEFVVLVHDINKTIFDKMVNTVRQALKEHKISISTGSAWKSQNCDLNELLKEADERMYEEKRDYYENSNENHDRRSRKFN